MTQATINFGFVVRAPSPPTVQNVTVTARAGAVFMAPVLKGTVIADVVIDPAGWIGSVNTGGPDGGMVVVGPGTVSGGLTLMAAQDLLARSYSVDIIATDAS